MGDSRFASVRKKFAKAFPSPSSIGTGSRGGKGTGFQGLALARVRWVGLFAGLAAELWWLVEAFWAVTAFPSVEAFVVWEVLFVVEVEVSSAPCARHTGKM
jgi:hypothetical protein